MSNVDSGVAAVDDLKCSCFCGCTNLETEGNEHNIRYNLCGNCYRLYIDEANWDNCTCAWGDDYHDYPYVPCICGGTIAGKHGPS